ncbi:ATP-grasp domain-containing protein, partial [Mammaliicoccus sciuri]
RLTEKETLKSAGTKVVPFISVKESTDIDKAIETLGYPFIVKTRFGGYDGKGQVLINNEKDLQEGFKLIETSECVAEKYLN